MENKPAKITGWSF